MWAAVCAVAMCVGRGAEGSAVTLPVQVRSLRVHSADAPCIATSPSDKIVTLLSVRLTIL